MSVKSSDSDEAIHWLITPSCLLGLTFVIQIRWHESSKPHKGFSVGIDPEYDPLENGERFFEAVEIAEIL